MSATAACPPPPPASIPPLSALGATLEGALGARPATRLPGPGRRAAVMIVLYEQGAVPHMLLTKRSDHLPSHPGQISLPGGVIEPDDRTERDAALRETEEEVGIGRAAMRVIGDLDDVHTMVSGFIIHPFVAVLDAPMIAVASDGEVARLIHAPVADLFAADALLPPQPTIAQLRYPLAGEDVWGATARILRTFSHVARCALSRSPSPSVGARGGPAR